MDRFYKVREGDAAATPWNVRSFKLRPRDENLCAPPGIVPPPKSGSALPKPEQRRGLKPGVSLRLFTLVSPVPVSPPRTSVPPR